jgi:EmrB/QacA subfamily drug resistance transporter
MCEKPLEYKWTVASVTTVGGFMGSVDSSIVIIALPTLLHDLNATLVEGVWIVAGYTLTMTIFLVALGRVGDMFGRVRLFNLGFVVFTVFSAFCGLSQNGSQLVVFRLVQGIGAALLIVNSVALIADTFPASELGLGIGIYFMAWNVGAIAGYTLGGVIVALIGWRYIFFVNVPIGIFGIALGHLNLKEIYQGISGKFDYVGTALYSGGLTLILAALTLENVSSSLILLLIVVGIVSLVTFVFVERRLKEPALDLSLFREREFTAGNAASFLNTLAFNSLPFVVTLYLELVRDLDPLTTGLIFVPMEAVVMVLGPISGKLSDRYSARVLSSVGLLINAIAIFWFSTLEQNTSFITLMIALGCLGLGRGLFASPNARSIMRRVPDDRLGVANGIRTTIFNTAGVVSVPLSLTFMSLAMPYTELSEIAQGALLPTVQEMGTFLSSLQYAVEMSAALVLLAVVPSLLRGSGHKSG